MIKPLAEIGGWSAIPNCVPVDHYHFRPSVAPDAPLVFLGRIEEIKGPHLAIEIALRANRRLVIAGNVPAGKERWFNSYVRPHLDDDRVRYIGPVDDRQKNTLLGEAAALLMPILWEEPFGIVMAEALACGTPVLGLRRGAVPEIVKEGMTGFVRETTDQLVDCMLDLPKLSRSDCRASAENDFSADVVVEKYLHLYKDRLTLRQIRKLGA